MDAMRRALSPLLPELPEWMAKWIIVLLATAAHPRTRKKFQVPAFRLLYKLHKSKLGFRGITGNFCWATQPIAELVAYIYRGRLEPNCRRHRRQCELGIRFQRRWVPIGGRNRSRRPKLGLELPIGTVGVFPVSNVLGKSWILDRSSRQTRHLPSVIVLARSLFLSQGKGGGDARQIVVCCKKCH